MDVDLGLKYMHMYKISKRNLRIWILKNGFYMAILEVEVHWPDDGRLVLFSLLIKRHLVVLESVVFFFCNMSFLASNIVSVFQENAFSMSNIILYT